MISVVCLILPVLSNKNLYVSWSDYFTRFNFHDHCLNLMYFYWTNFWFVIPLIITILVLNMLVFYTSTSWIWIVFGLVLINYLLSLTHYISLNSLGFPEYTHNENVNPLLTNSINKYHPFIFYTVMVVLGKLFFEQFTQKNVNKSKKTIFHNLN